VTIPKAGAGELDTSMNKLPVTSENSTSTMFVNKGNN
jgi:hypothetical protein